VSERIFEGTAEAPEVVARKRRIVTLLLARGARLTNEDGSSPALLLAAFNSDGEMLRLLLNKGVSPNGKSPFGDSALLFAVLAGNHDGATALLEAGAEVNYASPGRLGLSGKEATVGLGAITKSPMKPGITPLFYACRAGDERMARVLLTAGADLEAQTPMGARPLHGAIESGDEAIVSLLLERSASLSGDTYGTTPLHLAASKGRERLIAMLLDRGAPVDARDYARFTPLLNAVENGHRQAVELLVLRGADPMATMQMGRDALHLATLANSLELMRWAIEKRGDIGRTDNLGMTPLHIAALHGYPAATRMLLQKGANVNATSLNGNTPLHDVGQGVFIATRAAEQARTNTPPQFAPTVGSPEDYVSTAMLLLTNGARLEAMGEDLTTPLHAAATSAPGVAKLLLERGADIEARDKYGFTPLQRAARFGTSETVELLLAHGARLEIEAVRVPKAFQGFTLLHWAANNENLLDNASALKALLRHKLDPRARDANGATALHWAAWRGNREAAAALAEAGAELNARDFGGQTPLHLAVDARRLEMVEWLLAHHADPTIASRRDETPLELAQRLGFFEIVQALRSPATKL